MRVILYIIFIFTILLMSWDLGNQDSVIAMSNESSIPDEAIRLRIIANSDSVEDQWLKREITGVVVNQMDEWVNSIDSLDEARLVIERNIPILEKLVKETVNINGFNYNEELKVELGSFPFPTKMYGQNVYPAGDYEALRVTLGAGEGENWWCVLFPPLCFIDMSTSSAIQPEDINTTAADELELNEDVEVKFFVVELLNKIKLFFAA
ncbi:MAG: stage II sporulation protein R [Vulcanibacillus sp.]